MVHVKKLGYLNMYITKICPRPNGFPFVGTYLKKRILRAVNKCCLGEGANFFLLGLNKKWWMFESDWMKIEAPRSQKPLKIMGFSGSETAKKKRKKL